MATLIGLALTPGSFLFSLIIQGVQAVTPDPTQSDFALRSAGDYDELIDRWHNGAGNGMPLHTFLGMSWDQYAEWVMA